MDEAGAASAAHRLEGMELAGGWRVLNKVEVRDHNTGGAWSVCYLAANDRGGTGFVKAVDYAAALDADDPARALEDLTAAYNAERDLLELCGSRRLRRIVRALAAGTVRVDGASPPVVSYLVLEMADGDARDLVEEHDESDMVAMLRLAHHAAVALAQLHSIEAAHQDVKPSNFLYWKIGASRDGKLGDLGHAHVVGRPAPHDDDQLPGDPAYAAPEQLYGSQLWAAHPQRRQAADVFALGGLTTYLLAGVHFGGIVAMYLENDQRWANWGGTFEEALPALVDAHGRALQRLREASYSSIADDLSALVDQMCYPDPARRGDPIARRRGQDPYGLERAVTKLDQLGRRLAIDLRQRQ